MYNQLEFIRNVAKIIHRINRIKYGKRQKIHVKLCHFIFARTGNNRAGGDIIHLSFFKSESALCGFYRTCPVQNCPKTVIMPVAKSVFRRGVPVSKMRIGQSCFSFRLRCGCDTYTIKIIRRIEL